MCLDGTEIDFCAKIKRNKKPYRAHDMYRYMYSFFYHFYSNDHINYDYTLKTKLLSPDNMPVLQISQSEQYWQGIQNYMSSCFYH